MRTPRYLQVSEDTGQYFHVVSRCVRRAFLCGVDEHSGRSYHHRKQWIEARLYELAEVFAVAVYAYAVMSNHLHVLLFIDPTAARRWSDGEVVRRWLALTTAGEDDDTLFELKARTLLDNPERVSTLRERLGSLSWFMRYLKEPIARRANRDDGCTGHFWEGRFKLQDSLDDVAVLSQMVYIDLNPLRAGLAECPKEGPHTSAVQRDQHHESSALLTPVAGCINAPPLEMTEGEYLALLGWTGHALYGGAPSARCDEAPRQLTRLGLAPQAWSKQVKGIETCFSRAVGSAHSLTPRSQR